MGKDPFSLQRFVDAQDPEYANVCQELRNGRKQGHWMWFVFPQIKGLGSSGLSVQFAISSRGEAEAYLGHPVLGRRLRECTGLVLNIHDRSIDKIFGYPDNLKFRSSMTLFGNVGAKEKLFFDAIQMFYGGKFDRLTIERL